MNHMENIGYEGVLKIVSQWPTAQQIALVEDVLRTISSRVEPPRQRRRTLDQALGLLATDRPSPTDEEVEQWLDEH
ncbi:MAG: hypothetical protein ACREA2_02935, partial [Blastocatellia bacterium]